MGRSKQVAVTVAVSLFVVLPGIAADDSHVIHETIAIDVDGTCDLTIDITILKSSPLAAFYRTFVGLDGVMDSSLLDLKNLAPSFAGTFAEQTDARITHTVHENADLTVPVGEQIIAGIIAEHELSLGITFTTDAITVATLQTVEGACEIHLEVTDAQVGTHGRGFLIGPSDIDASFERIGFLLLEIENIQALLKRTAMAGYQRTWSIDITVPRQIYNGEELGGRMWQQDFGNDNQIHAGLLSVDPVGSLHLQEVLLVNKEPLTVTPAELVEGEFFCYKVFTIDCGLKESAPASRDRKNAKRATKGKKSFSWSWNVLDHSIVISFADTPADLTLTMDQEVTVSSGVSWKTEYFILRKFKAYLRLDTTVDMTVTVDYDGTVSHELEIFSYEKPYYFVVWGVPVEVTLQLGALAKMAVDLGQSVDISYAVRADGYLEAGVGWKKRGGWSPIRGGDFAVTGGDLGYHAYKPGSFDLSITPSLEFSIAAKFYDAAGPFVSMEPYATLQWDMPLEDPSPNRAEVGANVSGGITFDDWIEDIFDLSDYQWEVFNFVFWEWEQGMSFVDVAVLDVEVPERAFIPETTPPVDDLIPLHVTVANLGNREVTFDLVVETGGETVGHTIGTEGDIHLVRATTEEEDPGEPTEGLTEETISFLWDSSVLAGIDPPPEKTTIVARITNVRPIAEAGDTEDNLLERNSANDRASRDLKLEIRDAAVVSVTPHDTDVVRGEIVTVDVVIANEGTVSLPSTLICARYSSDGEPPEPYPEESMVLLGDTWCDSIRVALDLTSRCEGGDVNGDGNLDIGDGVFIFAYLFARGPAPDPRCVADTNRDEKRDIGDGIYLLQYLFTPGSPPPGCTTCKPTRVLTYEWDTSNVSATPLGTDYVLSAKVPTLDVEYRTGNNILTNTEQTVRVRAQNR